MAKGSKNSGNSTPKEAATIGYMSVVPSVTMVKTVKGEGSYETKSRVSYGNKQSGSYGRETTKEKASAGAFQWKNGTSGTKCEYQKSSTLRVGDKSGYTEVYNEQRVRKVRYNNSSASGGNKLVTYNYGGNAPDYGCDYRYDSDY